MREGSEDAGSADCGQDIGGFLTDQKSARPLVIQIVLHGWLFWPVFRRSAQVLNGIQNGLGIPSDRQIYSVKRVAKVVDESNGPTEHGDDDEQQNDYHFRLPY